MALPQIQELDPWLEEDEEVFFGSCKKASQNARLNQPRTSLTTIVMTVAKFSFYFYLLFKVHRKLQLANSIITGFYKFKQVLWRVLFSNFSRFNILYQTKPEKTVFSLIKP